MTFLSHLLLRFTLDKFSILALNERFSPAFDEAAAAEAAAEVTEETRAFPSARGEEGGFRSGGNTSLGISLLMMFSAYVKNGSSL